MASFSIHEFYFAALNKSNYHLPLFHVAHFKHIAHMDSHKAEGPDRHCPCYVPSPWPVPHLGSMMQSAMPNYGGVMGFLCWVSVSSWGDSSEKGGLGGQPVTVEDISGTKRWEKRRLVLGECLAVLLEPGKVQCSWLDHCRMKWSSAGLFRWGAGGEDHGMGMRMSEKVGWRKLRIDTDRREQDCLMRVEHGKKDVKTWEHSSPAAQEKIVMFLSPTGSKY